MMFLSVKDRPWKWSHKIMSPGGILAIYCVQVQVLWCSHITEFTAQCVPKHFSPILWDGLSVPHTEDGSTRETERSVVAGGGGAGEINRWLKGFLGQETIIYEITVADTGHCMINRTHRMNNTSYSIWDCRDTYRMCKPRMDPNVNYTCCVLVGSSIVTNILFDQGCPPH